MHDRCVLRELVLRMTWDDADTCSAQGAKLRALSDEIVRDIPGARLADDQWLRRCDVAFDIGETQKLPAATVDAICARIRAAGARCITSSVHAHAFFGDHDKAAMCVRAAHASGLREVRLIHGRGIGVQRGIVQKALDQHPLVMEFFDDPDYHLGATVALLIPQ